MVEILDQFGRPIKKADLTKPFAAPTLGSVRQVISGHPADGLEPRRLFRLLRDAAEGEPEAYFELAEEMEERDMHYQAVLSTRKRQVAQLPITVISASDEDEDVKHADFIREWLDRDILRASLVDILDAVGKGYSITEIEWDFIDDLWLPKKLTPRPQRWFKPLRDDGETLTLRENGEDKLLPQELFIVHRHPSKSGLTVRSGLAFMAAWGFMYKSYTLKDWALFVQNYGMPIRIGRYGTTANQNDKEVLWRAVRNVAGDMAAIIPDAMNVEFIELKDSGKGSDLYEKRADWWDRQISKLVLGQTTTTDAISGGHAVAQEHRLVQEDIERSDAAILSATLNQQLIRNIIAFNFGPQIKYPKIIIGRMDELAIEKVVDVIAKTGLTVEASWLRDRIGAPEPAKDAETVGGQKNAAQKLMDESGQKPELNINQTIANRFLKQNTDAVMERLGARVEHDTAGAMAGLTDEIKNVIMSAKSFDEMSKNLMALKLDPSALSNVLARGLALSHLAGQAALIDELEKPQN